MFDLKVLISYFVTVCLHRRSFKNRNNNWSVESLEKNYHKGDARRLKPYWKNHFSWISTTFLPFFLILQVFSLFCKILRSAKYENLVNSRHIIALKKPFVTQFVSHVLIIFSYTLPACPAACARCVNSLDDVCDQAIHRWRFTKCV